jgi:hypothetical protein
MSPGSPGADNIRALLIRRGRRLLDTRGTRLVERRVRRVVLRGALGILLTRLFESRRRPDGAVALHRPQQISKGVPNPYEEAAPQHIGKQRLTRCVVGFLMSRVQQITTVGLGPSINVRRHEDRNQLTIWALGHVLRGPPGQRKLPVARGRHMFNRSVAPRVLCPEVIAVPAVPHIEVVANDREQHRVGAVQQLTVFDGVETDVRRNLRRPSPVPTRAVAVFRLGHRCRSGATSSAPVDSRAAARSLRRRRSPPCAAP